MSEQDETDYTKVYRWNHQDKKKPWLFYTLIASVCFAIAWVMS
ncbi:MAG: hypothetical protein Q9N02_02130 [Ghiorsea sp.]|nr:hypothetical protein [Ghiorsea sp.]